MSRSEKPGRFRNAGEVRSYARGLISRAMREEVAAVLKRKDVAEMDDPATSNERWDELWEKGIAKRDERYWQQVRAKAYYALPRDLRRALGQRSYTSAGRLMAVPRERKTTKGGRQ